MEVRGFGANFCTVEAGGTGFACFWSEKDLDGIWGVFLVAVFEASSPSYYCYFLVEAAGTEVVDSDLAFG
jgi:hypothetical protein